MKSTRLRKVIGFAVIVVSLLVATLLWMAGGIQSERSFEEKPIQLQIASTRTSTSADQITVVAWNIAWAYGWGSEGSGSAKPAKHFADSIQKIGEAIAAMDADIVLLQEVDFDSTRSHGVDQATQIARAAGLPYVAQAVSWDANWVPFPYWPPSEHFGRMSSGGAILSRFPIEKNRVQLLHKPDENPFWYNLFYLFRYLQTADIKIGPRTVRVFNVHLEAFQQGNRVEQAERVREHINQNATTHMIFGGDCNTVPPESKLIKDYPDEKETDHSQDRTLEILRGIASLNDVISVDEFSNNQAQYFTFPAHEPNRKLDYIFSSSTVQVLEAKVAKEVGPLSDHLPIAVKLQLTDVPR